MNHDEFKDRLFEFHDGALAGEARAEMVRHLGGCGTCRERLADWKRAALAVASGTAPAASPGFVSAVMVRIAETSPRTWPEALQWLLPTAGLALASVLFAFSLRDPAPAGAVDEILFADRGDADPVERLFEL